MKSMKKIGVLLLAAAFLMAPQALAKKDGNPSGWLKGEKKGWNGGEMPPGLAKDKKAAEKEMKKKEKEAREKAEKAKKETEKKQKEAAKKAEEKKKEAEKRAKEAKKKAEEVAKKKK